VIYPANKDEKTMINLTVVIDNDEAVKKLRELQNVAKTTTSSVVKDSERMDASWQQMKNSLMSLTAGVSFAALAKQVVQVRGEVQQLEVAFETMLGSKQKADTLMTEIIDLAAKTPFGLQDVSNATKMLLAYGSTAEQVADEIKMLGNIASGLSIPLNDMIYLYGTTRTQGRMFTQDLRQFMGRGIPLAEELAKQFGVTKDKVGELVTAGKVGFDEMAKALQAMTSEGGKFNNLMDKQSQTIAGQISNLEDAIYQMFNEIGQSSEGVISDMISGASWVVEHYQSILKVLTPLIAAYGAYKTAIIVVAAAQKAMALGRSIAMFIDLAKAITSAKDAMLLLNMATNANPLGILLSLLAAIGVAVWQFSKGTEDAARQMGALEKAAYDEYIEVNRLVGSLRDANLGEEDRVNIINQLKTINPSLIEGLDNEATAMDTLTKNLKAYNEEQIKRIQLGALQDQHGEKLAGLANAELQYTQMKAEMDAAISKLVADYQLTGKLPAIDASWNSVYNEKEVATSLKSVLDKAIAGTLSGDELARQLYLTTTPLGVDNSKNVTIKGFDIGRMTKQVNDYKKAVDEAQKDVVSSSQNMQEVMKRLGLTPEPDKPLEDNNTTKELTEDEKKAAEKRAKELAELKIKLRKDAEQAEIDAMADGTDKKIAQAELDWKRQRDAIQKMEKELINKQGKPLTDDQKKQFSLLNQANAIDYSNKVNDILNGEDADFTGVIAKMKADKEAWNEYLIQYGNFQEKIKATTEKYATEIANAKSVGERMSLEAERDILLAEYEVQAEGYAKELAGKTTKQLNKMLEELTAQVEAKEDAFQALDSTTGDDAEKLRKEIAKLKAQIKELKAQTGEASDAISNDNWADAINLFQNIGSSATEAAEGISEFDENLGFALKGIAQLASLSVDMIGALQGVQKAFEKTGEAASAMEKASAILAVVSVAIKAVSGIFNIMKSNEEATRNATLAAYEYAHALEKISNIELRESFSTIFGKDNFGEFSALLKETQENLNKIDSIRSDYIAAFDKILRTAPKTGDDFGTFAMGGLDPTNLVADMRSGWQKFVGSSKNVKVTSLDEFYENGVLNVDKLKAYYDNYKDYLTEAQANLVKSLIDAGELYSENVAAMNSYLTNIFGDLGASITDSVVDAFRNGTDAAEAMGDAVSNVLERIATDMAHAAFIQPLLEQAQDGIDALNKQRYEGGLSDEEYMRELMGITSTLMGNAQDAGEGMAAYLDTMRQMAKEMGIDLFESDSSKNSTHSKGYQTMSQETGSELNGRFTDIQGQTHRIAEAVEFCKSLHLDNLSQVQSINTTVAMIHNDTSLIAQHTKALANIDANLDALRRSVDNGII
jgi:tape measure domain-containing protein